MFILTGLSCGGAENQVVQLCRGLRRRGWEVQVISLLKPEGFVQELEQEGASVLSLGMKRGLPDPRAIFRLAGYIRSFRPDVIHSHMVHANLLVRLTRLICRMPRLICTAHNMQEGGRLREWLYRLTDPLCDWTTNVSERAVQRYVDIKAAPASKISRMPNGVDLSRYARDEKLRAAKRKELGVGGEFIWLAAGRFVPEKDHTSLLKAYARTLPEAPSSHLLLAGDGPCRPAAEQLARELGIASQVHFLGLQSDMTGLMNAADAFVMSSRWEGLPMVLLEASACELPMVATDVGGNAEIVQDGGGGWLVEPSNPDALAEAMLRMRLTSLSERQEMGRNARAHVLEGYELNKVVERWVGMYLEQGRSESQRPLVEG
ncbi:glycosyl transferase family 1 [Paenibacillus sp. CAA11]|nr:glycosyl transferase family 1 [Paenibacillus sp. CAA11]